MFGQPGSMHRRTGISSWGGVRRNPGACVIGPSARAVATSAGEMPARWVIHAATMHLGGPTSAEIIRTATASTLAKADELGAKSLGLVAFGTGVGGFPVDEAARIEVEEVRRHLAQGGGLERVVFAIFGAEARRAFEEAVADG
jgi:O-acetyl-ADP-ribose deacetylase